jgi:hypothetical protein
VVVVTTPEQFMSRAIHGPFVFVMLLASAGLHAQSPEERAAEKKDEAAEKNEKAR